MTDTILVAIITMMIGLTGGYFFKRWNRDSISPQECQDMQARCKVLRDQEDSKFIEFKKEMRESLSLIKGMLITLVAKKEVSLEELKDLLK